MLIGIDASQAAKDKETGVEIFCYELILHLLLNDQKNQYILYSDVPFSLPKKFKNAKIIVSHIAHFWHNLKLPKLIRATKPDIFISPGYMIPLSKEPRMIAVVHDFATWYFPKAYSQKDRFLQKLGIARAASKASAILFVSKSALSDFEKYYPNYSGIKQVVYQNFGSNLYNEKNLSSDFRPTTDPYILSVGRLEERKNTKNLVKAYGILRNIHPDIKHKLVLIGNKGYRFHEIEYEINRLHKFKNDVIFPGHIHQKDIYSFYKNADVFAYPSLYEGFGIPILEAFLAGTPVACSDNSSIPEVAGESALYFDPKKPREISDAIYSLLIDKKLSDKLVSGGRKRLKLFSWDNAAKDILEVIEKI